MGVVDIYLRRGYDTELGTASLVPIRGLGERVALWRSLTGRHIETHVGDLTDAAFLTRTVRDFAPDTVIHLAEQRSAPGRRPGVPMTTLSVHLVLALAVLAVIAVAVAAISRLGTARADAVALVRAVGQLALVSLILTAVLGRVLWSLAFAVVMLGVAVGTSARRVGARHAWVGSWSPSARAPSRSWS